MRDVFICDAIRTPIGRFGGALAGVRADDLAAVPLKALIERNPQVDWTQLDEVFLGCANQAGEDNRNVARMALLLAGLPQSVPGVTSTACVPREWMLSAPRSAPSPAARWSWPSLAGWSPCPVLLSSWARPRAATRAT